MCCKNFVGLFRSLSESFCIDRQCNYKTLILHTKDNDLSIFASTFVQREIWRLVFETWFSPFHFHGCAANAGHAEQALNFLIGVSDEGRREGRSRKEGREKQRVAQTVLLLRWEFWLENRCEKGRKEKMEEKRWKRHISIIFIYFLSISTL